MRQSLLNGLAAVLLVSGGNSLAGDTRNIPPGSFALADVAIEFVEGGNQGRTVVRVEGTGKGSVRDTSAPGSAATSTFAVKPKEVFALLELCYREHFFDLPEDYGPPNSLRLDADGMIDTINTVVADAVRRGIVVHIGNYSKSVGYLPGMSEPPAVVAMLEKSIDRMRTINGDRSAN